MYCKLSNIKIGKIITFIMYLTFPITADEKLVFPLLGITPMTHDLHCF